MPSSSGSDNDDNSSKELAHIPQRQQGNRYRMTPSQAVLFKEKLPVGTYTVGFCEGYYFEQIEDLELPKKLYGNTSLPQKQRNQTTTTPILSALTTQSQQSQKRQQPFQPVGS